MEKASKNDDKFRVGIYTQVSVGVATTGEGLASNEEKSPAITISSGIGRANSGRSCEPTTLCEEAEKSSVECGATRELDAAAGGRDNIPSTSSTYPSCLGSLPMAGGSSAVNNSSIDSDHGSNSSGTSSGVHCSGSSGVTYAAAATASARNILPSGAGTSVSGRSVKNGSAAGRGRPNLSAWKKLQPVGGKAVKNGSASTGVERKTAQKSVPNLRVGVFPGGRSVKNGSSAAGGVTPLLVRQRKLQPDGSRAVKNISASIGMVLNSTPPPLLNFGAGARSSSVSVNNGSSTAGQSKPLPSEQKKSQPDGSSSVKNSSAPIGLRFSTSLHPLLNSGAGTSGGSVSVKNGSSGATRGKPPPSLQKKPQPDGSSAVKNSSASTGVGRKTTTHKERRNAQRLLKQIGSIPLADLDSGQSAKLKWAKSILAQAGGDLTSKRQRSLEDTNPDPKRPKVNNTVTSLNVKKGPSFSDILKDKIVVAVIDRSNADGRISSDQWSKVIVRLSASFMTLVREHPGPPPITDDAGWHQGRVKLIACEDQRSRDLFTLAVSRLGEIWPGASLEVVAREDIPCRPRARTWIPIEPASKDEILQMIQYSNPNLPTHDWIVAKLEEIKGSFRSAILVINKESLAPLVSTESLIRYGFHKIALKVYKKDEEDAQDAPPQDTAAIEDHVVGSDNSAMDVDNSDSSSIADVSTPTLPSEKEAPFVDELSDMETVDSPISDLLSEEDLLRSSSEAEDADQTVLEVDLTNCSFNAAVDSD